jgi:hypothetical protein
MKVRENEESVTNNFPLNKYCDSRTNFFPFMKFHQKEKNEKIENEVVLEVSNNKK